MVRVFLRIWAFMLLAACSESHNQGNLQVVNQSPVVGAKAVATDAPISVTFSDAIDPATVNSSNFKLLNQSGQVEGTFKINGNTVTFTPSEPLFLFSKYSVTVSPTIYGTSGQIMPQSYQWDFTTRDGLWDTLLVPLTQGSDPGSSRAAIDDNGRVMLALSTATGTYSSFFDSGVWTTPVLLGQRGSISGVVSVNDSYAVFWQIRNGDMIQFYCARYTDGAWQPTEMITEVDATAMYVIPTMFSDNSLLVIYWFYGGADGSHAYSRRFLNSQGWQEDVAIADQAAWLVAGSHRSGKAVIAWKSSDGLQDNAFAQNYDVNSGWSTPTAIGEFAHLNPNSATVNVSGQSMVVFSTASDMKIASNTLSAGWTQLASVYEMQSETFYSPAQIAMDNRGNAMLVATEGSASLNRYFAIRYDRTNGWQQPVDISGDRIPGIMQRSNTLKVDESGNFLLVWHGYDSLPIGVEHMYSSRYQRDGAAWATPAYLGRLDADTMFAKIAMNQRGEAVAVWQDFYPPFPADYTMSLGVGVFK